MQFIANWLVLRHRQETFIFQGCLHLPFAAFQPFCWNYHLHVSMKSSVTSSAATPGQPLIPADVVSEWGPRQTTHEERLCLDKYGHCPFLLKRGHLLHVSKWGISLRSGGAFRISWICGEPGFFSQLRLEARSDSAASTAFLAMSALRRVNRKLKNESAVGSGDSLYRMLYLVSKSIASLKELAAKQISVPF